MAGKITPAQMEELQEKKAALMKEFFEGEPPAASGESLLGLWEQIYDEDMQKVVVKTVSGPSSDEENPVMPYEKLQAVVKDGGNWKWPRMWQRFDEIERRGEAFREGEACNFKQPNKNPNVTAQKVLVVGGGPIGVRMAIELVMGGHLVTLVEKRRELRNEDGSLKSLGFTNRINRPHMWPFVRNDLLKLNGKDLLSTTAAYPVFTEPDTSSIGIDELQLLLLKNALMLGVEIRLGVGYVNSSIKLEDDTCKPSWNCELSYDKVAAAKYGVSEGISLEEFDCLVACDGPRSTVREKQQKYFGNVEKRKFMDCVGIVANVLKVPRKRLKELGFEHGQEPGDMNRTKMVFKEFFGKIQAEADADIENLIYYKASTHNYTILVPKKADLVKHNMSGRVYSFHAGREGGNKADEEKEKLKNYCFRVLKAAGIPVDDALPNGGFVGVPNDCMAFDFAECWNTKKSMHFSLPPPNYSIEEDGEWEGKKLVPFIALAGDALLEPFWPMGLGLKRGWQAIMDTTYAVDNIFNATCFMEKLGKSEDDMSWDDHFEALMEQCGSNFEMCNRLQVSEELALGEYADKSIIMTQLKKRLKDPEKPLLLVEVDPWTRYAPLASTIAAKQRAFTREERDAYIHPIVAKAVARKEYYDEITGGSGGGKAGEIEYRGKELISINGKVVGGYGQAGTQKTAKKGIGMGKGPKSARGKKGTDQATGAAQQGTSEEAGSMAAAMMAAGMKKKAAGEEVTFESTG